MSAKAKAIRDRRKRDPYAKGIQLAPKVETPEVRCERPGCHHQELIHGPRGCMGLSGTCSCPSFVRLEAP